MKGQTLSLPIGEAWASITVGSIVQTSLRTKEQQEARCRHAIADGVLKRFWQSQRNGMHSHTEDESAFEHEQKHRRPVSVTAVIPLEARSVPSLAKSDVPILTVGDLFERWSADRADKRAPNTIKRYRGSIRSFEAFAKGRDVRTLTGDDVFGWVMHRRDREGISPRAINKNDLVAVSSVFRWGAGRASGQLLSANPATGISLDEPRIAAQRERTFREGEIAAILSAALQVTPEARNPTRTASRRWCPWLAAYSGARIAELTNLHRGDICTEGGVSFMRLRVTKSGEPRTVPIHGHLIEQGFMTFVEKCVPGPLFYDPRRHGTGASTSPGELQGHKVGKWVRETIKLDPGVDPNHGWRHTWKTRALGVGIEERLRDAITGHKVASVGRRYETPTLKMLADAMGRFPRYQVGMKRADDR
ncbi:site-specific integrase [Methylobacterium sp. E-046]|uniref:tyrosine-type recombinase/integrase n=1 Tax=Methylobacterium sp. E-046 TaxID=2836576 RepID=UPI001FBA69ED|nr:tyrosine-type recombinase/integrase [Methylobacterium sp. E-046]